MKALLFYISDTKFKDFSDHPCIIAVYKLFFHLFVLFCFPQCGQFNPLPAVQMSSTAFQSSTRTWNAKVHFVIQPRLFHEKQAKQFLIKLSPSNVLTKFWCYALQVLHTCAITVKLYLHISEMVKYRTYIVWYW